MTAQQPEALRLAGILRRDKVMFIDSIAAEFEAAAKLLEHQHARVQELEAQRQVRKPLLREQVKAVSKDAGYWDEGAHDLATFINGIRHGERAHGITGP